MPDGSGHGGALVCSGDVAAAAGDSIADAGAGILQERVGHAGEEVVGLQLGVLDALQVAFNTVDHLAIASRDWPTFRNMMLEGYDLADDEVRPGRRRGFQALSPEDKVWCVCYDAARAASLPTHPGW